MDLTEIRLLLKLKEVERYSIVKNRKESSAEHSWATIILAEYFLKKIKEPINELKVLKLLAYHDLIEIISKDHYEIVDNHKRDMPEDDAFEILIKKIPEELREEYTAYYNEFKEQETIESKFAKAIDKLEVLIQMLDYKEDWHAQKWSEEKLRNFKEHEIKPIPIIYDFFNELINYLKENNYFVSE